MNLLVKGLSIICLLLYVVIVHAQSSDNGFEPFPGSYDLEAIESRIKPRYSESPSRRQKFRFPDSSEEVTHVIRDDDDVDNYRSYTVGAHFQVSHPATYISRKNTKKETLPQSLSSSYDPHQKAFSFSNFHLSTSDSKYKEPISSLTSTSSKRQSSISKNHHKRPTFKASVPEPSNTSEFDEEDGLVRNRPKKHYYDYDDVVDDINSDDDFIPSYSGFDKDPRNFKSNHFKLQNVPNLYPREKQFRGVASKGQIEKYLEDQQKYIDEALQIQLLNDPNPNAKGNYHQFLKSKDDERIEKEYEDDLKKRPQSLFKSNQPKRFPNIDRKKPSLLSSLKKFQSSPGLSYYRTPKHDGTYTFNIDI